MAADAVDEVKSRLDIIDVISGYVTLQRNGREFKGLCPFHGEKTPSFTVSPERQAWYCFGCSEGGDMFAFVQKIENIDFRQALEQLAERAGVELASHPREGGGAARKRKILELNAKAAAYFQHVLWKTELGAVGQALLADRGVDTGLAEKFGVGFAPAGGASEDALVRFLLGRGCTIDEIVEAGLAHERGRAPRDRFRHRLIFPIRDDRGEVIAFGGRALGDAVPKYLNSPETAVYHKSNALFGVDLARETMRSQHQVLVVEGYFDVIAAHRAGMTAVVASSGTALTREQVRFMARFTESITLCFDNDQAGQAAASRAVDTVAAEGLSARLVELPEGFKDPDELVQHDPQAFVAAVDNAKPEWSVLLRRALGEVDSADVDSRRRAAERAVAVLARIPVAATRDLYAQQAGELLGLHANALLADVARVRKGERPRKALSVTAAPSVGPPAPVADGDVKDVTAPEEYLAAAVLQRPHASKLLEGALEVGGDEIKHPHIRAILELARSEANDDRFPMHMLPPDAQATAARLLLLEIPEIDDVSDGPIQTGLASAIRRLREATILESIGQLRREPNPDPVELNAKIAELTKLRRR